MSAVLKAKEAAQKIVEEINYNLMATVPKPMIDSIEEIIQSAIESAQDGWVSCMEPPDNSRAVIIGRKGFESKKGRFDKRRGFFCYDADEVSYEPTHWMELPKLPAPPKVEVTK